MRIPRISGLGSNRVYLQPAALLLLGVLTAGFVAVEASSAQVSAGPVVSQSLNAGEAPMRGEYKAWLDQDVQSIIKADERSRFLQLRNDEERDKFIEQFWLRRDPEGAAPNTYRSEHYRRIAYANQHFANGTPGYATPRGQAYILTGTDPGPDHQ